jgi:lysophospholipase L1-like esterase
MLDALRFLRQAAEGLVQQARQGFWRVLTLIKRRLPAPPERITTLSLTMADRRSLPVLCFGDSLTEGYHGVWVHPEFSPPSNTNGDEVNNVRFRPYAARLGHRLAVDVNDATEGYKACLRYACTRAYSGFTAEELLPQLRAALRERHWRAVCILAGSNDVVLQGVSAETALARLRQLHEACDAAGVPVVAVTPPDADTAYHGLVPSEVAETRRQTLAQLSADLTALCARQKRPLADARAALPLCADHYDDCMHLSAIGSDALADVVYQVLHRNRL